MPAKAAQQVMQRNETTQGTDLLLRNEGLSCMLSSATAAANDMLSSVRTCYTSEAESAGLEEVEIPLMLVFRLGLGFRCLGTWTWAFNPQKLRAHNDPNKGTC